MADLADHLQSRVRNVICARECPADSKVPRELRRVSIGARMQSNSGTIREELA
jgi:hypothetical protein